MDDAANQTEIDPESIFGQIVLNSASNMNDLGDYDGCLD